MTNIPDSKRFSKQKQITLGNLTFYQENLSDGSPGFRCNHPMVQGTMSYDSNLVRCCNDFAWCGKTQSLNVNGKMFVQNDIILDEPFADTTLISPPRKPTPYDDLFPGCSVKVVKRNK